METTPEVLINKAQRILLICHTNPDGDAVGSLLGMGWAMRELGKQCVLACSDPVPPIYHYLPGSEMVTSQPQGPFDLIITLDCSDLRRLGSVYESSHLSGVPIINIDHHITNANFGTVNLVDAKATSTAEVVLGLLRHLGISLNQTIATCLLNGIVTDTRGFSTPNTTRKSMEAAIALMDAGAPLAKITDQVFNRRPLADIRLWAEALHTVRLEGPIIWAEITPAMRLECGFTEEGDAGLANFLITANEAEIAVVFSQQTDGRIEVGMRSVPSVDVSTVALDFGGGGHPQAAGFSINGSLGEVREQVIAALKQAWLEQNSSS
ncbi:MAG: bifunctional oligoribonuclease/PAP phosphatase NrnA [Anaerolineae bacterium]|jgi:phosphoesterase RecJ-like protein|nr:bifunctional oligoribonuclease/PAP phosphatase NrnA [Anaerolineae bacterium]MDH7474290.1 bifunctional oligoribonuclease/PAP phosphatase NrnA [Anaerolineae bacterium]